ncbi:homoserine dehydrogenase [Clostridium botulinum]|uniref:homoserine dehydrogenase n=1 Tax=Clostridium botulinum TaxID=1491 RepID=UPI0005861F8C|nr:homoserine dehydrogenase [Clostridium botulinum]AJD26951.1 ACT domain protein [Clostridium botulinum CDC_297]AUN03203.1 homoserine dehydrogenase [Clostridium botulinum]MBN3397280.1 homoserine dehydrogenase [Clostridium botulinum]MBN3412899.1 homoserine dehydrogenase [Clostridium botulinum]MBY6875627.1 homoserine dehydrogenase [Clostridium botulinum]
MEKVKIALLGLGNVGKGVWNILRTNKEAIIKRAGYDIEISKILVKDINKQRGIEVPKKLLTTDVEEIFNDDSIKIVVEVIGGLQPAKEYILRSIKNKKHVITANKMLIATNGKEIFEEAKKQGVIVNFEASVAGGIPVINSINESLTANKIEEIVGIINGTTNYILTKMTLEGMSFEEALKEAQKKGYAEADPTSDVEGYDAVYKLAILTTLAFETNVDVNDIYVEGITKIKTKDIEYSKELGYVIKLLAIVKEVNEKLELRVHPTMIPSIHPLANVNDSFNSIFIKGNAVGDLMLYGRGAGELPTGSAVVGDIISVVRNEGVPQIDKNYNNKEVAPVESIKSQYYLRISVKERPGVLAKITAILGENNVSILSFIQKPKKEDFVSIVLVTHYTLEGNINKSIEEIENLDVVDKIKSVIRIESLS